MAGWLYEQEVSWNLYEEYGFERYLPGQWFKFQRYNGRLEYCQTDGLLFTPEQFRLLIVEVKYKHTPDAYWQLEDKYVPVLRRMFPNWEIATVEIVKWFDPSTPFPTAPALKKDILSVKPNEFGVHIMNP